MTPDRIIEFAEELSRIAAAGGGPKALAAHLSDAAGMGVLVEDAEWRHVATAGKGSLPATARGLGNGRVHTVAIASGTNQLGYLSVFPGTPEVDQELVRIVRLAAAAIALELAREADGGRTRRRTFWERLIGGAYHEIGSAREDAAARGVTLATQYVCIALEAEPGPDEDHAPALAELRALAAETFRASDADVGILERGVTLTVLVPAGREVDAENAKTAAQLLPKSAAKRKSGLRIAGGVSAVVAPLGAQRGVANAEAALTIGRRIYGGGRVAAYDELGAYALLYDGADVEHLRALARAVLAPLRAYDEKHQTELERTLALYFATGQNVKTTASELNVHRHTVFYRLRQINEISGRSLESAHDQLTLRLALAIDALHNQQ
ncbi:MAG TPA: helix-turn-helix domain-containing protein [Candidatus Baltobacteraceae bacterium]|nr:helix-turn-helix domain-containing protein [Candidatus Baltobacteraceae bacterium]